jgi:hypothetical protein
MLTYAAAQACALVCGVNVYTMLAYADADVSCKTQMLAQAQGHGGEGGAAGGLAAFAAKLQGSSHKQGTCFFFLRALHFFFVVVVSQHISDLQNTIGYAKCDATQLAGIMSLANVTEYTLSLSLSLSHTHTCTNTHTHTHIRIFNIHNVASEFYRR